TVQLGSDGPVQQHGGHAGVHSPGETQDYLFLPNFTFQFLHGGFDKGIRGPILSNARNPYQEVLQESFSIGCVVDLWMELYPVGGFPFDPKGRVVHIRGPCQSDPAGGQFLYGVAMAHPYLAVLGNPLEEALPFPHIGKIGPSVFTGGGGGHLATTEMGEVWCPVTNPQRRLVPTGPRKVRVGGVVRPYRGRGA